MLAESAPLTFCRINTAMLTYPHNHALEILLGTCSCCRNEKQNSKFFFNYDANLTSVITMEFNFIFFFAMLVSLYDVKHRICLHRNVFGLSSEQPKTPGINFKKHSKL